MGILWGTAPSILCILWGTATYFLEKQFIKQHVAAPPIKIQTATGITCSCLL